MSGIIANLSALAEKRSAWALLFLSALMLEFTALYFQYGMDLKPCIMCIYQRTAVFGLVFAGFIAMLKNNLVIRVVSFAVWGVSAIWGLLIAVEHVDLQNETNPFFVSCEIVPNFPAFLPLHDWLPNLFAATGDCGNIDWQFAGMSMPQWMIVIFALYTAAFTMVIISRLLFRRSL